MSDVSDGLKKFISGYAAKSPDNKFHMPYQRKDLALDLVKLHDDRFSNLGGDKYFACVDMKGADGKIYDIDFFMVVKPGKLTVTETSVHKINGKPLYNWKQEGGVWKKVKGSCSRAPVGPRARVAQRRGYSPSRRRSLTADVCDSHRLPLQMNAEMPKTFFITTAIDYTNSPPHVGHAYEKVLADVIARYHRLKGENVFFLTGVDQHGQKVQQSAAKAGVPPAEFVKGITQKFIDLWKKLDVRYDEWAETTSDRHKKVVQGILQRLFDEGQIYKDKQSGYYSVRQEQFLTDKERGPDGQFGPEWGEIEFREEENYYFKLSQHKDWLLQYLDNRADAVVPDFRQTELRNAVEKISGDLCISRPKSRLDWGIELPFDKDFVTYVWFDALTNYISFAGYDPTKADRFPYNAQPQEFRDNWSALASHRQRHSRSRARHLLADHAARDRISRRPNAAIARARLVEPRRREDEQERGQHHRSFCVHR